MNFKKRISCIMNAISNSTIYKVLFECDKELIPSSKNQSLIERCSLKPNVNIKRGIDAETLIVYSASKNKCLKKVNKLKKK